LEDRLDSFAAEHVRVDVNAAGAQQGAVAEIVGLHGRNGASTKGGNLPRCEMRRNEFAGTVLVEKHMKATRIQLPDRTNQRSHLGGGRTGIPVLSD
jgi:hypothetical protein